MRRRLENIPTVATFRRIWPFLKPDRRWLYLIAAVTLVLTAIEVAVPILVGGLVDSLLSELRPQGSSEPPVLGRRTILVLLAAGAVLRGYLMFQQRALAGRVGQQVAARMRDAVWKHLQNLPLDYTRRRGPGRLLVRFISDARAVQRLVSRGIVQLAQDLLVVAGVLVVMVYLDWRMGLTVTMMVPVVAGIFWYLNPRLQQTSRDMRRRRTRLSAHLNGRIKGLDVVKSYGQQKDETRRVRRLNGRVADHGTRREAAGGMLLGASAGTVALFTVLVLALASGEVASGRLTGGELVTFYALIGLLAPIFQRITMTDRTLQEAHISMHRLAQTLAEEPESPEEGELPDLDVGEGTVSVEEVSFEYPDGTVALENASLTARRGELVVIVGPNGAGKSTLLELLPRFREPTSGRIYVDGQDITGVSLGSLRSKISLVTQDTPLFDGTIAENVGYGAPSDASEEQVRDAARLAGVDEIVASLPDGWETKMREGRRTLSAGQRQRVALARALVADPPILVLDQAAAAVDVRGFRELLRTVRELARYKTVIIATHNADALLAADRIFALEGGRTLEVSARALREQHEGDYGEGTGPVFDELSAVRASAVGRPATRTTHMRDEGTRGDDNEDDDDD